MSVGAQIPGDPEKELSLVLRAPQKTWESFSAASFIHIGVELNVRRRRRRSLRSFERIEWDTFNFQRNIMTRRYRVNSLWLIRREGRIENMVEGRSKRGFDFDCNSLLDAK